MSGVDLYDWSAVDARTGATSAPAPRRSTRRGSMILAASLLAVGDVLDPAEREPIIEESPDPGLDASLPVVVHLVRGQPRLSSVLLRHAG